MIHKPFISSCKLVFKYPERVDDAFVNPVHFFNRNVSSEVVVKIKVDQAADPVLDIALGNKPGLIRIMDLGH